MNIRSHCFIDFTVIPPTENACCDSREEKLPAGGRNLQQNLAQYERPSATADWEYEKTEQIYKNNRSDVGVCSMLKKVKSK